MSNAGVPLQVIQEMSGIELIALAIPGTPIFTGLTQLTQAIAKGLGRTFAWRDIGAMTELEMLAVDFRKESRMWAVWSSALEQTLFLGAESLKALLNQGKSALEQNAIALSLWGEGAIAI